MTAAVTEGGPAPVTRCLAADHPALAGHFPGQPLLPGVVILSEVLAAVHDDAALAACVGTPPVLASARFLAPVVPQDGEVITLTVHFQPQGSGLRFEVRRGALAVARGQFAAPRAGTVDGGAA